MAGKQTSKAKRSKPKVKDTNATEICDKHNITEENCLEIQKKLLKWYDKEQRTLPWRDIAKTESDPNIRGYAVWVSEVMLQQTQVATVIPYYNKWMKKWPTASALAAADIEEVLQMWAGLGYYSRGRRLHEGAKIIMEKLNGQVPSTVEELMKLIPGIGAYSASAIASVAFQKVAGVVDGNVIRVLSRLRIIGSHVSLPGVRDHLWLLANKLVSKKRPGDFNQALMELGAMVCTPQNPNCALCPLNSHCSAYSMTKTLPKTGKMDAFLKKEPNAKDKKNKNLENGELQDIEDVIKCSFCLPISVWNENPQVTSFPCKIEKKSARQEKVSVLVVERKGELLMVRRPEKGLLAGLWEFPSFILPDDCTEDAKLLSLESLAKELGIKSSLIPEKSYIGEVVHLFSHIHTTYIVEHLALDDTIKVNCPKKEAMWITLEGIKTAAVSTAMKKVLALVKKSEEKPIKQAPSKKRKRTSEDAKQRSIKSFFS